MSYGFKFSRALLLSAALVGVGVAVPVAAKEDKKAATSSGPAVKLSKEAAKLYNEGGALEKAGDLDGALAKFRAIEALPNKKPDDQWAASNQIFGIALKKKDSALQLTTLDTMLSSPFLPNDGANNTLNRRTINQIKFGAAYNSKNYAAAFQAGRAYYDMFPADTEMAKNTMVAGLLSKDYPNVVAYGRKYIAANPKADEVFYKGVAEALQRSKDPQFSASLVPLVRAYPTTENWKLLLEDFQIRSRFIGRSGLDLFRLMVTTGTTVKGSEIAEAAQIAMDSGVPWETRDWLKNAAAAGKLNTSPEVRDLQTRANAAIASEAPMSKQEAQAAADKSGNLDGAIGQVYFSQANYAKAQELFQRALTKSPRNRSEITLRLGMAQAMAGDKTGAATTLKSVTGDPKLVELASLWALYAELK